MPDIISKLNKLYNPDDTDERCGFVLKRNIVKEVDNVHPEPTKGFEIDAQTIIDHEDQLVGTWHTHVGQGSTLSMEDHTCFLNWPHLNHYIISKDGVKTYVVEDGIVINAD